MIYGLGKLETLILDENSLFSLPAEIGELSSLNILSLRSNNLTELPGEVSQLTSLSILNVVGNRYTGMLGSCQLYTRFTEDKLPTYLPSIW